tara:strand:+ start:238 stop:627 length:390 start_codon:yes stop_codon:yes gene_type:complete
MIEQLGLYLTSVILGTMVFFSFVVAPVTFTTLNEENARKFIRKIFPYYYLFNLTISILTIFTFIFTQKFSIKFYLISLVAILFIISNFILMPLINKYRDTNQDKKFKYSHSVSVFINFIQIIILVILLI